LSIAVVCCRLRKTDNNRIARASGATIVHRPDEIQARRMAAVGAGPGDACMHLRCSTDGRFLADALCVSFVQESDVGTGAGLFEVVKIGEEFFTFIVDCKVC
jgi:T-complex protein 1 subunit gamma